MQAGTKAHTCTCTTTQRIVWAHSPPSTQLIYTRAALQLLLHSPIKCICCATVPVFSSTFAQQPAMSIKRLCEHMCVRAGIAQVAILHAHLLLIYVHSPQLS